MFQHVRRGVLVLTLGATLAGVGATPVAADQPQVTDVALTSAQQQAVAAKTALAQQEAMHPGVARSRFQTIASCPFSVSPSSASSLGDAGTNSLPVKPALGCNGQWGYVPTYPKVQDDPNWCGPASIQVVSNYVWRMPRGTDKYPQWQIAGWAGTTTAGTNGSSETRALNIATAGSPYLPANWVYLSAKSSEVADGSYWHALLRIDIASYSMPQVVSVAPKDPGFGYYLTSWTNAKAQYAGHYIVLNAFDGAWNNTRGPMVYYDDSAIRPSGVASGDPAWDIYQMIMKTNANKSGVLVAW
jgi:hypothetical protein